MKECFYYVVCCLKRNFDVFYDLKLYYCYMDLLEWFWIWFKGIMNGVLIMNENFWYELIKIESDINWIRIDNNFEVVK